MSTIAKGGTDRGFPKPDLEIIRRQARVAVTPRNRLLKAQLANGAVVYGRNRPGFGGRAVYIYGEATEPEFEHLDSFLDSTGVFVDIGANTGKWAIKAAQALPRHRRRDRDRAISRRHGDALSQRSGEPIHERAAAHCHDR